MPTYVQTVIKKQGGGYVVDANDVAFSNNNTTKSIQDVLSDLTSNKTSNTASDIIYTYINSSNESVDTTVKNILDSFITPTGNINGSKVVISTKTSTGETTQKELPEILKDYSTESLQTYVTEAQKYANSSQTAAITAGSNLTQIQQLEKNISATKESFDTYNTNISNLNKIAEELHTSFDVDADYVVLSTSEYNNKPASEINAGTIYLCYD